MSSSSSAPCDCFYCQYGMEHASNGYGTCPFYATMGQPYVYYAQVPRDQMDRRRNPNFFIKAFRWYTQEHTPLSPVQAQYTETSTSAPAPDPDVAGFANWLDSKYEQFLREGHAQEERCVVVTQTSEGMGVQPQCQSQPGGNKRFTRIRLQSPWRKRRLHTNNATEGGDVPIDTNKSVVYLLEPKDLPRPISECCQVSSTPCCSVATVVGKKVTCSRSATNTFTRCDVEHIDPVSVQEGITLDKPPQAQEHGCKQECTKKLSPDSKYLLQNGTSNIEKLKSRSKSRIAGLFKSKKTDNAVYLKNVSCECSTLPPPKPMVDAETQYDIMVKYACECTSRPSVSNTVPAAPPVALAETKPKQTWFQKGLLKISPKTSKPQKDVKCQCEPDPKVDKNQYCTQCGCRCTEMREKLLCCECVRMACAKEPYAQVPLTEQVPPPPMKYTEYAYRQDTLPASSMQQESIKPNIPYVQQPKLDMPPLPPPTATTATTPTTTTPPTLLSSPSASTPKPMREVSVVTEPQSELSAPEKSDPYTVKGKLLGRTSFPCTICNSTQTSDHAINLDQGIRGYPLFLKIVCADRLNEDCFCRQ